jgi:Rrf2 family transcriptional regulator, cysteine metabolism repressor
MEHKVRITSKGRYGLRAMMELARPENSQTLLKTREISEKQNIPLKYLEQIVGILKKNNLVQSARGAEGGYRLSRPASQITVFEILTALEGDLSVVDKSDASWETHGGFWNEVDDAIKKFLEIPLVDFVERKKEKEELMFYI